MALLMKTMMIIINLFLSPKKPGLPGLFIDSAFNDQKDKGNHHTLLSSYL